jgi:hypothetical protein
VVSAATLTGHTEEEVDRGLALVAAMNLLDAVTVLAAAKGSGGATTMRTVASPAVYGGAALAFRLMQFWPRSP